jgi:hypothetical protein
MEHSPVAHHFYRLRRLLMDSVSASRAVIRPSTTFAEVVPPEDRQRVWPLLEREGLQVPLLSLPRDLRSIVMLIVLVWAGSIALASRSVLAFLIALADGSFLAYRWSRRWATVVEPELMTIGDAAICMTTPEECRHAGYRLSEREIFVKVRMILWRTSQISYEKITPQTRFIDLLN